MIFTFVHNEYVNRNPANRATSVRTSEGLDPAEIWKSREIRRPRRVRRQREMLVSHQLDADLADGAHLLFM